VLGTWIQPRAVCSNGQPTYSSVWVGIGGYSVTSQALEQIGTEADCTMDGKARSSAWFEMVPAASQTIRIPIAAGDRIRAAVSISGEPKTSGAAARASVADEKVTLTLTDLTKHRRFSKTVRASVLDTTSAEWIVEAPSVCSTSAYCQTLPLADFGSTEFTGASAESAKDRTGPIDDGHWTRTKITLDESGRRFVDRLAPGAVLASATPSRLIDNGHAFTVTFNGQPATMQPAEARLVALGRLVHGARLSPTS
jgi:hypothetical protein